MSKKLLYNGQIRWFKNKESVEIPSLLMRRTNKCGKKEVILIKETKVIHENEVIKQLYEYKENCYHKDRNQINEGNVLFRLKCNKKLFINDNANRINKYRVICQSEDLANYNKNSKGKSSKALIEKALLEFDESKLLNINEFTFNDTLIKVFPKQKDNNFKKSDEGKAVLVEILDQSVVESRNEIVNKMISVNKKLYKILNGVLEKVQYNKKKYLDTNLWEERVYDLIKKESNKFDDICEDFLEIVNYNEENFVNRYLFKEANEVKILFSNQMRNVGDSNFKDLLIKYLYDFLLNKGILKKVDIIQNRNNMSNEGVNRAIKTYITKDKHSNDEADKVIYKELIDRYLNKDNLLLLDINTILEKNNYQIIFDGIVKSYQKGIVDNKLFGEYKKLYSSNCVDIDSKRVLGDNVNIIIERFLLREVYRYGKGRIRKLINNSSYLNTMKESNYIICNCKKVENKTNLNIKIEKHVKSRILNYILYEGKLVHEDLKRDIGSFDEFHALDELFQEVLVLLSSVNYELNKDILKNKKLTKSDSSKNDANCEIFVDYLNDSLKKSEEKFDFGIVILNKFGFSEKINKFDITTLNASDFVKKQEKFGEYVEYYVSKCCDLRSKIIHAKQMNGSKSIINESNNVENEQGFFSQLDSIIKENLIDDKEICDSLNFKYVFKNKKDSIDRINKMTFGNGQLAKYMPGFNKLIPKLKKAITYYNNNNIDEIEKAIIDNAVFYLFKVIYRKEISNKNSNFINKIIKKIKKDEVNNKKIEEEKGINKIIGYYKRVQQKSAQGSYGGIKKYQNMIVDEFIKYINSEYRELLDYTDLENLKQSIENKEEDVVFACDDNESDYTIRANELEVKVKTDFEFVIMQSLLLVEPMIANMILNRINATSIWLSTNINKSNTKLIENLDRLYQNGSSIVGMKKQRYLLYKNLHKEHLQHSLLVQEKKRELDSIIAIEFKEFSIGNDVEYSYDYIKLRNDAVQKVPKNCRADFMIKVKKVKELDAYKEINELEKYAKTAFDEYNESLMMIIGKIDDDLIKEKYIQGKMDNPKDENLIFNHELYNVITNNHFETIFDEFYKNRINNHQIIECDQELIEVINKVDSALSVLTANLKGKSKSFKSQIVDLIKIDSKVFKKYMGNDYENIDDFKKDYKIKITYQKQENLLDFRFASLFYEHVLLINYKLMLQIYKFERDMHYFIRGLEQLDKKYKLYIETDSKYSVAYRSTSLKNHYTWNDEDDYDNFKNYCIWFDIKIMEALEDKKKSIRNYIAHFHMLKILFNNISETSVGDEHSNQSIINKIYEVNNFMSYRSQYNNGAIKSSLEVLKKNVAINYDRLGEYFDEGDKILDLITPITSTPLELESQYHEYSDFLKYWFQYDKSE